MLTTEVKIEVAKLRQAGMTLRSIGDKFGHSAEWARQTAAKGRRELRRKEMRNAKED